VADVRALVLHGGPLPELGSASSGLLELAQPVLVPFVLGDGGGAASASARGREVCPQAAVAGLIAVHEAAWELHRCTDRSVSLSAMGRTLRKLGSSSAGAS
jgi:hypothetical protein